MAYRAPHQPLVYNLRIRLAHTVGLQHGYRPDSHHHAPQGHHLSFGKEELHEFGKDASAQPETRRGYQAIQQTRGCHDEAAGHDATLLTIWREPSWRLPAYADSDA